MSREPMRVGKDSTEPVDSWTGLTPTETRWLNEVHRHLKGLNKLLEERGETRRYWLEK